VKSNNSILLFLTIFLILITIPSAFAADIDDTGSLDNDGIVSMQSSDITDSPTVNAVNDYNVDSDTSTSNTSNSKSCINSDSTLSSNSQSILSDDGDNVIYVSVTGDDSTGTGTSDNPYGSLYMAINKSSSGSIIKLSDGVHDGSYGISNATSKYHLINLDLTFIGSGNTVIDFKSLTSMMLISGAHNVTLENLTIVNIKGAYAVSGTSGNLTLNNMTFKNCVGTGFYSFFNVNSININNSRFLNINHSYSKPLITYRASPSTISNSVFVVSIGVVYPNNQYLILTANNNYWGSNEKPNSTIVNGTTVDTWVVLDVDGINNCSVGDNLDVTPVLSKYTSDGETFYDLENPLIAEFDVRSVVGLGTLNQTSVNSSSYVKYTAESEGQETLTISVADKDLISKDFEISTSISNVLYVDASSGSDGNDGSKNSPYATISKALDTNAELGGGYTVIVKKGNYALNGYNLNNNVTITSKEEVNIFANGNYHILMRTGAKNVSLIGLTFTNGSGSSAGSISMSSSTNLNYLTIDNCSFIDNKGPCTILNYAITNITRTNFINNTAKSSTYGVITVKNGSLDISYSNFVNNVATSGALTGIYIDSYRDDDWQTVSFNVTANYNYWGSNDKPNSTVISNVSGLTLNYWTVLTITPEEVDDIASLEEFDFAIDFSKYSDGTSVNNLEDTMPELNMNVGTNIGTLNTTYILLDGQTTQNIHYSAPLDGGDETVSFYVENALIKEYDFDVVYSDPDVIYVSTEGSDEEGSGKFINPYATLAKAIEQNIALGGNKTIIMAEGTYKLDNNVIITKNVTIIGNGSVILDGQNKTNHLNITAYGSYVNIENLTFINGYASSSYTAGSINYTQAKLLNLTNCKFIDNKGDKAIVYANLKLYMDNCKFINNTVSSLDNKTGILYNYDGAIVNSTVFIGNKVSNTNDTGAIVYSVFKNQLYTYNVFLNNTAGCGDLYNSNNYTNVTQNYNYYGTNTPDSSNSNFLNNWTILTVTPEVDDISIGDNLSFIYDFTKYTDGNNNYTLENPMPDLVFELKSLIGNLNQSNLSVDNNSFNYESVNGGNETISLNIEGYDVYDIDFNVLLRESYISLEVEDIEFYDNETVIATVADGVTGNITFVITNGDYLKEETVDIVNSAANLTLNDLPIGDYTVVATYNGDSVYKSSNVSETFTVSKRSLDNFKLNADDIYAGQNLVATVTGLENATGTVNIKVTRYDKESNENITVFETASAISEGQATVSVPSDILTCGDYEIIADYYGNDIYNNISSSVRFEVNKFQPVGTLTVNNITYGNIATATVSLYDNDNKGINATVIVTINSIDYEISVVDGVGAQEIADLNAGNYSAIAFFEGNDKYESVLLKTNFTVNKNNPLLNMNINDTAYGNPVKGLITLTDSEGNPLNGTVAVTVADQTRYVAVIDGIGTYYKSNLTSGEYTATVKLLDSNNYNSAEINKKFEVTKLTETEISIFNQNDDGKINATVVLPEDATGTVNYIITDEKGTVIINKTIPVTEDITSISSDKLANGNYTITATYSGDNNYPTATNTTTFEVINPIEKTETKLSLNINNTSYGNPVKGLITLTDSEGNPLNGTVAVTVADQTRYIAVVNGTGTYYKANLTSGEYTATASLIAPDYYDSVETAANFEVTKATETEIALHTFKDDKTLVTTVLFSKDATGNVNYILTDENGIIVENKTSDVNNGSATITSNDLTNGNYTVTITYSGDNNYPTATNTTTVEVINPIEKTEAKLTLNINDTSYGNPVKGLITLTDSEGNPLNGTVTVTLNNQTRYIAVVNGTGTYYKGNLTTGNYTTTASLIATDYYDSVETTANFEVTKTTSADMGVYSRNNNGTLTTKAVLPEDATGNISYIVTDENGTVIANKTVNITNGTASINTGDLADGNYTITTTYSGDDNYPSTTNTRTIELINPIEKVEINLTLVINDTIYGEPVKGFVTLIDKDGNPLNGTVLLTGGNNSHYISIINGKGSFYQTNIPAGDYTVNATLIESSNYNTTSTSTTFEIAKVDQTEITINNQNTDGTINTTITLPENAKGNITYVITDENGTIIANKTAELTNGTANISNDDLANGNYTVTVNYSGDNNYKSTTSTSTVEVINNIKEAKLTISCDNITYGDNATIQINLTDSDNNPLSGNLIVSVNGTDYNVTVTNGTGSITTSNISGGFHKIKVNFTNEEYGENIAIANMSVEKLNTILNFKNMTTKVVLNGARTGEYFNVTLTDINGKALANKTIYIGFNGKVYKRTTNSTGGVQLQINIGYQSANTFSITFLGDENYSGNVSCAIIVVNTLKTSLKAVKTTYTYKSSAKTKTVKATLKLSNGTVIKGQTISVKINGAIYQATTNSKGVATIKIPITTKGTYTATITFAGNNQYTKSTASTKVKIS